MFELFTTVQLAVAITAGLVCALIGLAGRRPSDLTMGLTAFVDVLLIAQLVVAILSPVFGNNTRGDLLEFYTYLVSAILVPVAALIWALIDRSRWSTVILGVACFTVAIMLYRMHQIWYTIT